MAFTDPQSLTFNAVPYSMPRTQDESTASLYTTSDENVKMKISHSDTGVRVRHMARIDKRVVAPDPITNANAYQSLGVYLVVDRPKVGFTATDIDYVVQGFKTWLTTANVTKIVGQEH